MTANSLLETEHTHALDMQLEKRVDEFYAEFEKTADEINEGKGILIMTDMGSLNSFGELYTEKTGVPTRTIDFLSTPFVLEALRKTLIIDYELDEIYSEVKEIMYSHFNQKVKKRKTSIESKEVIITTCLTGQGAAIALANFLRNSVSMIAKYNIELFPTNNQDFRIGDFKNKKILAIVGIDNLNVAQVPFIPSEKILLENGLLQLRDLISSYYSNNDEENLIEFSNENGLMKILNESLTFLNPQKTLNILLDSFEYVKNEIEMGDNQSRYLILFVLHCASMIERVLRTESINYPEIENRIQEDEELYSVLKAGIKVIENNYMLEIPNCEMGFLMDIFDTK